MTWRKIVSWPEPEHICLQPNNDQIVAACAYVGSEWECDSCGNIYVLLANVVRGQYEGIWRWERVA